MELPDDICKYIYEFARPLTRGDWRKGSSIRKLITMNDIYEKLINMAIDVPVEYVNYLRCNLYNGGYMILNYRPTFQEAEKVFNCNLYKLTQISYSQCNNTYLIRNDYIELELL